MTVPRTENEIVVGIDGSASSAAAVEWAAHDAQLRDRPLRLVHVVPPIVMPAMPWPELPVTYAQVAEDRAHQIVEQSYTLAVGASSPGRSSQIATEVVGGPIVSTLVGLSKAAEMIVVGSLGETAATRAVLGSVSSALVHRAHCPVAVIHGERPRSLEAPVVVGVDGSEASELATEIAFAEASQRRVDVVALHAWSDMGPLGFPDFGWAPIDWRNMKELAEKEFAGRLSGWRDRYPEVRVLPVVVCDRPANRLLEQAESAQLIVVGSHGRGAATSMLLGSVSSAIVHSAQIPVIVARQG
ncbi:universal stress protein [Mycobacterium sp. ITM-2017-0098]|nr:universal stress protein [Mycobacterium sp. ITM-2017-0098]